MYRVLLVPLDRSSESEYALPIAHAVAHRSGACLRLVHVHEPDITFAFREGMPLVEDEHETVRKQEERAYLQRICERLEAAPAGAITSATLDGEGAVAGAIAQDAAETGADLIVMTTHGWGGLTRFWLGSVAEALVRGSHIPILLVRPAPTVRRLDHADGPPQMLIPLDGSALAARILKPALALGDVLQAEYTLLHVVTPLMLRGSAFFTAPVDLDPDRTEQRRAEAQRYLDGIAQTLRDKGKRVSTRVIVGPQPAIAVLEDAHQHHVDLIALATHGRGGLKRALLGSVADKVLRGADMPLLLYRPQVQDDKE